MKETDTMASAGRNVIMYLQCYEFGSTISSYNIIRGHFL